MQYSDRLLRNSLLLRLDQSGLGQKEIGQAVGLSQQAVSKIVQRAEAGQPTCQKRVGATARLAADQLAALPDL